MASYPTPRDSPSPSAFIYTHGISGRAPFSETMTEGSSKTWEFPIVKPEPHDLNDSPIKPMYSSPAPLWSLSQSYRREGTSLPLMFTNVEWAPRYPVACSSFAQDSGTRPCLDSLDCAPCKRLADTSGVPDPHDHRMPRNYRRISDNHQKISNFDSRTLNNYQRSMDNLAAAHSKPSAGADNQPQRGPIKKSRLGGQLRGLPETHPRQEQPSSPKTYLFVDESNLDHGSADDEFSDNSSDCSSSSSSPSLPPQVAHELRTICLAATQRYIQSHPPEEHANHFRHVSTNHGWSAVTPPTSTLSHPGNSIPSTAGLAILQNDPLSCVYTPIANHTDTTHAPSSAPSYSRYTHSYSFIPFPGYQHQPSTVDTRRDLLTNITTISSLIWKEHCQTPTQAPYLPGLDEAALQQIIISQRRGLSKIKNLLRWAEIVASFEGDVYENGEGDSSRGMSNGGFQDRQEVDGGQVLEAAERICEMLGDGEGLRRVGDVSW